MRAPAPTDFEVVHPVLGTFIYGRRTYGDRIKIRTEFLKELGRPDDGTVDADLAAMCAMVAAHRVLCVRAPAGWEDLARVELMTDPELHEAFVVELYADLKAKEDTFRRVATAPRTG